MYIYLNLLKVRVKTKNWFITECIQISMSVLLKSQLKKLQKNSLQKNLTSS